MRDLLRIPGINPNIRISAKRNSAPMRDYTPLHWASRQGFDTVVEELLKAKEIEIDVILGDDATVDFQGLYPLTLGCSEWTS